MYTILHFHFTVLFLRWGLVAQTGLELHSQMNGLLLPLESCFNYKEPSLTKKEPSSPKVTGSSGWPQICFAAEDDPERLIRLPSAGIQAALSRLILFSAGNQT